MGTQVEQLCTVLCLLWTFVYFSLFLKFLWKHCGCPLTLCASLPGKWGWATASCLAANDWLSAITLNSHTCNMLSAESPPPVADWVFPCWLWALQVFARFWTHCSRGRSSLLLWFVDLLACTHLANAHSDCHRKTAPSLCSDGNASV